MAEDDGKLVTGRRGAMLTAAAFITARTMQLSPDLAYLPTGGIGAGTVPIPAKPRPAKPRIENIVAEADSRWKVFGWDRQDTPPHQGKYQQFFESHFNQTLPPLMRSGRKFTELKGALFTGTQRNDDEVMGTLRQAAEAYKEFHCFWLQKLAAMYPDDDPRFNNYSEIRWLSADDIFGENPLSSDELEQRTAYTHIAKLKEAVAQGLEKLSIPQLKKLKSDVGGAGEYFRDHEPELYQKTREAFEKNAVKERLMAYHDFLRKLASKAGIEYSDLLILTNNITPFFMDDPYTLSDELPMAHTYEFLDTTKYLARLAHLSGNRIVYEVQKLFLSTSPSRADLNFVANQLPEMAQRKWQAAVHTAFPDYKGKMPHLEINDQLIAFAKQQLSQMPEEEPSISFSPRSWAAATGRMLRGRPEMQAIPEPVHGIEAEEAVPALPAPVETMGGIDLQPRHAEEVMRRRDEGINDQEQSSGQGRK